MNLTGLDIETTGTDVNKNHRLIQIGIVLPTKAEYVSDVQPIGDLTIETEALKINRFTLKRIAEAPLQSVVDLEISQFLATSGYKAGDLTPVGFNVGGFDMGFIKRELPKTAEFFSYRTLDLTGVAMMYELKTGIPYRTLKEEMHKAITIKLGKDERHDALYDAKAALCAVDLFKDFTWSLQ